MQVSRPASSEAEVLQNASRLAREVLLVRAEQVDMQVLPLRNNFDAVAQAGLAGLPVPSTLGGAEGNARVQRLVARELASACGVTQFTLAQHWSACKIIAQGQSEGLRSRVLPLLASGRRWTAISFAHLRRPGAPMLRATPTEGGLRLDGTAPWVTGWGLMDCGVLGATLPDGTFVYVWTAFPGADDGYPEQAGTMTASEPMALCAMQASATVSLDLVDWHVPNQHILSNTNADKLKQADRDNVLQATTLTLGVLQAEARLLEDLAARKPLPPIQRSAHMWRAEVDRLEHAVEALLEAPTLDFDAALQVRVDCIEKAVRGAHAAVAAVSGSANLSTHPAQRLLREAMFYTVQAQTPAVMEATLDRLAQISS